MAIVCTGLRSVAMPASFALSLSLLLSVGCGSARKVETQDMGRIVRVTADDTRKNKLPPVVFSMDLAGTGLTASKFPEEDVYVRLSGPPGGVMNLEVRPFVGDAKALETWLTKRFSQSFDQPVVVGEPGRLTLAGTSRQALTVVTGQSMARAVWCAAAVPVSDKPPSGLVVLWGRGTSSSAPPACDEVAADSDLAKVLATFSLSDEPGMKKEPESIGMARGLPDGSIQMTLRATSPDGAVGDTQFVVKSTDERYAGLIKHLGGLKPGEVKPVAPFPDKKKPDVLPLDLEP